MTIATKTKFTRFMEGQIDVDGVIFDTLCDQHGRKVMFSTIWASDNIIYSRNFVKAVENGLVPSLEVEESFSNKKGDVEYHHVIIDDVCYVAYFN